MSRKSKKSLGLGGKEAPKVKNSQFHSRKLDQSQSKQAILEMTEEEYSPETPATRTRMQNAARKKMRK
jgi:hypothetical protein